MSGDPGRNEDLPLRALIRRAQTAVQVRIEHWQQTALVRRLQAADVINRGMLFAAVVLLCFVPFLLVLQSVVGRAHASGLIGRFGLSNEAARVVRQALTSPSATSAAIDTLSWVFLLVGGIAAAAALQELYEQVFEVEGRGFRDMPRRVAWLGVAIGGSFLDALTQPQLHSVGGASLVALFTVIGGTAFWWFSMWLLLGGKLGWAELFPSALATGICFLGMEIFFRFTLSSTIVSNYKKYGSVGVVFAIMSLLIALGVVIMLGALLGIVWRERYKPSRRLSHLVKSLPAFPHRRRRGILPRPVRSSRMALPAARMVPADLDVVFEASGVDLVRDGRLLLDQVSVAIGSGEHWALLGPNGAGKSMLLHIMATYAYPSRGHVDLLGYRLGRVNVFELRPWIGHVSPHHRVDPQRTVREVVLTGITGTIQLVQWRELSAAELSRAAALTELMGLVDRTDAPWQILSQGERSRALIARALMAQPHLLLMDEPAAGLDVAGREQLLASVDDLRRRQPALATVLVTHHLEELPASTTHALLLRSGRVLAAGPVADVLTTELASACFGHPVAISQRAGRWAAVSAR